MVDDDTLCIDVSYNFFAYRIREITAPEWVSCELDPLFSLCFFFFCKEHQTPHYTAKEREREKKKAPFHA